MDRWILFNAAAEFWIVTNDEPLIDWVKKTDCPEPVRVVSFNDAIDQLERDLAA